MATLTSLNVPPEDMDRLERIARQLGYLQTRGPGKRLGAGSVSRLLRAIAAGEIEIRRASPREQAGDDNALGRDGEQ